MIWEPPYKIGSRQPIHGSHGLKGFIPNPHSAIRIPSPTPFAGVIRFRLFTRFTERVTVTFPNSDKFGTDNGIGIKSTGMWIWDILEF